MKSKLFNAIETAEQEGLSVFENYARANGLKLVERESDGLTSLTIEEAVDRVDSHVEYLHAAMTGRNLKGEAMRVPSPRMDEALISTDASILIPRVIDTILREPTEPNLFLTNNVADIVQFGPTNPLYVMFPSVSAIQAFEVAEGQDYRTNLPSFIENQTGLRIRKWGVACSISDEVIAASQWALVGLFARMMSNAVARTIESGLFTTMSNAANPVFDNNHATAAYYTTGKGSDGTTANYSFSYHDLVSMFGVMLARDYVPTHLLAHPLTWSVFATDPIFRAQFFHMGQLGSNIWTTPPKYDQQANFPFAGTTYVPYYAMPHTVSAQLTGPGSGLDAGLISDLYLIDASNSLFMATKGPTEFDEREEWYRDAKTLKARRYAGFSAKDGGKAMLTAKNVRVARNYEPLMTVLTV